MKQISIRGTSYQRVKEHCEKHGISVASFVDKLCKNFFCPNDKKRYDSSKVDFRHILF